MQEPVIPDEANGIMKSAGVSFALSFLLFVSFVVAGLFGACPLLQMNSKANCPPEDSPYDHYPRCQFDMGSCVLLTWALGAACAMMVGMVLYDLFLRRWAPEHHAGRHAEMIARTVLMRLKKAEELIHQRENATWQARAVQDKADADKQRLDTITAVLKHRVVGSIRANMLDQ